MSFINDLFGKPKSTFLQLLDDSIEKLRLGIFAQLYNKYSEDLGRNEAIFLAAAILNEVVVEEPSNAEAQQYYKDNLKLIYQEA